MTELFVVTFVALAGFVGACFGFGGGLLAIPFLSLVMKPAQAITLLLIFQFFKGLLVFVNHQKVPWDILRKAALPIFVGCIVGVLIPAFLSDKAVGFLLGLLVLLYVLRDMLSFNVGKFLLRIVPHKLLTFLGGIIQGGFGLGGTVFVIYYNEMTKNKAAFRAALLATFFVCNTTRLILSSSLGVIDDYVIEMALYAGAPFLFALYLGQKFHDKLDGVFFEKVVNALLLLSAVALLVKTFL